MGFFFLAVLSPYVFVGVFALTRRAWLTAVGAWIVFYGQFFGLIYNLTHGTSGLGCISSWIY